MAASSGNISSLLGLVLDTASLTESDFIEKTIGVVRVHYYLYIDTYHVRPRDIEDLIDGLLYLEAKRYIEEQAMEKAKREAKK